MCTESLPSNGCTRQDIKEVTSFSDISGGQDRNISMYRMFLHSVRTLYVMAIRLYCFEVGQSQVEVDPVHGNTENQNTRYCVFDHV
jgi:hypothetical protein